MPDHIVIEGTATNLVTVRPRDLPDGTGHHLSFVRLTGNWSGRNIPYLDLVRGRCNADFRRTNIEGFETHKSDLENVKLTAKQADCCSYDIVLGFIRKRSRAHMESMGFSDAVISDIESTAFRDSLAGATRGSWDRMIDIWATRTGLGTDEVRRALRTIYADLPLTLRRQAGSEDSTSRGFSIAFWDGQRSLGVELVDWSRDMRRAYRRHDRWLLARHTEEWALRRHGRAVKAFCSMLRPVFKMKAIRMDNPDVVVTGPLV